MKQPCYLSDMGIICAAGNSAGEVLQALSDGGDYLVSREGFGVSESQMLGLCEGSCRIFLYLRHVGRPVIIS